MAFIKKVFSTNSVLTTDQSPRSLASLLDALNDPLPETRRWAARDLLEHPSSTTALVKRLMSEDDMTVREIIFTSLTRLGGGVAIKGLVECIRSEDARMRNEAIAAMKVLPVEVSPIMDSLLLDDDADVRIMAVNILEALRHPNVEKWLIGVIEDDLVVNVCGTAVDLLGEVGTTAAMPALIKLKNRFADEPYIQFATELAIKRIVKG
jgi:HEAT repeat protein